MKRIKLTIIDSNGCVFCAVVGDGNSYTVGSYHTLPGGQFGLLIKAELVLNALAVDVA